MIDKLLKVIHSYFKMKFKGQIIKYLFWLLGAVSSVPYYKFEMQNLFPNGCSSRLYHAIVVSVMLICVIK
ncbi:hypothetical protein CICLE_v10004071mg [Citrus x clementina]|uniref:Uncharacterized protein n=1 Tax=Citrus clementina TaxID=85681 RepID=V4UZH6_CITCL|nr:hypothetical protein CICLE_v10004071mg [Citrus x clementina]